MEVIVDNDVVLLVLVMVFLLAVINDNKTTMMINGKMKKMICGLNRCHPTCDDDYFDDRIEIILPLLVTMDHLVIW